MSNKYNHWNVLTRRWEDENGNTEEGGNAYLIMRTSRRYDYLAVAIEIKEDDWRLMWTIAQAGAKRFVYEEQARAFAEQMQQYESFRYIIVKASTGGDIVSD